MFGILKPILQLHEHLHTTMFPSLRPDTRGLHREYSPPLLLQSPPETSIPVAPGNSQHIPPWICAARSNTAGSWKYCTRSGLKIISDAFPGGSALTSCYR